jgi:hypothetical protein
VLHLIKKDILIQKKSFLLALALMFMFSFTLGPTGTAGLAVIITSVTYMLMFGAGAQEDKSNGDRLLASLPIRKETIVLAKYLSVFVYAAYAVLGSGVIHLALNALRLSEYSISFTATGVIGGITAVVLMSSITFPLAFKSGYLKSRLPSFILLFGFAFGGTILFKALPEDMGPNLFLRFSEIEWLAAVLPLAVYVSSYFLSLYFYRIREF